MKTLFASRVRFSWFSDETQLKWGAENGAPLKAQLWWSATTNGHVEILDWLYDAGVDWSGYFLSPPSLTSLATASMKQRGLATGQSVIGPGKRASETCMAMFVIYTL
jgi:hypothetical protein